jgi:hypothetical protein
MAAAIIPVDLLKIQSVVDAVLAASDKPSGYTSSKLYGMFPKNRPNRKTVDMTKVEWENVLRALHIHVVNSAGEKLASLEARLAEASAEIATLRKAAPGKGKAPAGSQPASTPSRAQTEAGIALGAEGLPMPETYAQAVMKSLNKRETQRAQAIAANRKKMAEESRAAKDASVAKRELELKAKYAAGYVEREVRLAKLKAEREAKAKSKKDAGLARRFVNFTIEQVEAHKRAILQATGATHWFSPEERKRFAKLTPEQQAIEKAKASKLYPSLSVARKRAAEAASVRDALAAAAAEKERKAARALCSSSGHKWSRKAAGKVRCSRCAQTRACSHALNEGRIEGPCLWCGQHTTLRSTLAGRKLKW